MYRINYIIFILALIIQQSLAGFLSDIENIHNSKLKHISKEDLAQAIQNIPTANMLKIQTFLKKSKTRLKLATPLLIAGFMELYLHNVHNNKVTGQIENDQLCGIVANRHKATNNLIFGYLPLFLLTDIISSSSYIFANETLHNCLLYPISMVTNIYYSGLSYFYLFVYSSSLSAYNPLTNLITAYAVISGYFDIKNRLQDRFNVFNKIKQYNKNINNDKQLLPVEKYLDESTDIFVYANNNDTNHAIGNIEDFYKWIISHKNDICLHKLIECSYIPQDITNESTKKLADIAKNYQPGDINNQIVHCTEYNLIFKLIEQNDKITQGLLIKTIQEPGIKVIEVDSISTEDKNTYTYLGFINDNKNYYLVIGIKLNNKSTSFPTTYKQLIWSSLFNDNADDLETSTLVIKFDSIDKIQSIVEYLLLCLDCNQHTCVYDVKPNITRLIDN